MTTTRSVAVFLAHCSTCGSTLDVPLLSDQEGYGEFIARGRFGRQNAYLNSFEEPWRGLWALSSAVLSARGSKDSPAAVQNLVSACIDAVDGETLTIAEGPFCSACRSSEVAYGDARRVGVVDLPYATCSVFNELAEATKRRRLEEAASALGV